MNITLKQLRAFVMVAREGSFTRAADNLHVTQSTLTSSIKILESELGMRLLDRSTRSVTLTAQGAQFLPTCDRLLRELTESIGEMRLTATRQRGSVVLAAAASFISYVLSPALACMAHSYPGINARLLEETTEGVVRLVLAGEADFGVTTLFEKVGTLDSALLLTDRYGVVYRSPHALDMASEPLRWSDLSTHTMIAVNRSNGIRVLVDRHSGIPSACKNPMYEVGSVSTLQGLLEQGFGYAVLPALAARPMISGGLQFKPLSRPRLQRKLYIVKKKGRTLTPAATAMLEAMSASLARIRQDEHVDLLFQTEEMKRFCRIEPGAASA